MTRVGTHRSKGACDCDTAATAPHAVALVPSAAHAVHVLQHIQDARAKLVQLACHPLLQSRTWQGSTYFVKPQTNSPDAKPQRKRVHQESQGLAGAAGKNSSRNSIHEGWAGRAGHCHLPYSRQETPCRTNYCCMTRFPVTSPTLFELYNTSKLHGSCNRHHPLLQLTLHEALIIPACQGRSDPLRHDCSCQQGQALRPSNLCLRPCCCGSAVLGLGILWLSDERSYWLKQSSRLHINWLLRSWTDGGCS